VTPQLHSHDSSSDSVQRCSHRGEFADAANPSCSIAGWGDRLWAASGESGAREVKPAVRDRWLWPAGQVVCGCR
jgi:hypothetical protein